MEPERYDQMLEEMILTLESLYEDYTGEFLGEYETQSLIDTLNTFFRS